MSADLSTLLARIAAELPTLLGPVLDDPRFATGRVALDRLADPAHRRAAIETLSSEEAAWMGALLESRWAALGPGAPTTPPLEAPPPHPPAPPSPVRLVAPARVDAPGPVPVTLLVEGLDEPIRVSWEGAVPTGPRAAVAQARAGVPLRVTARIDGRKDGVRVLHVAEIDIAVRTE